jgi:Cu2+-exporting ATPase
VGADCAHCGLPLGRWPVAGRVAAVPVRVCCYGCLLALQVTRATGEQGVATAVLVRLGLAIFFAINVMMVSMPTYVPYVYGAEAAPTDGALFQVLRVLALAFSAPVLLLLGGPILASAARSLRGGAANADGLIILGALAAYALSVVNTFAGRPAVYFDTAAMLLVLVTLGRYLEASAKAEAGSAIRARWLPAPAVATRLGADDVVEQVVPGELVPGDRIRVAPGEAFPTDGVVVDGTGGVDEAALTGESRPIVKRPGDEVASGTCSVDGLFVVRVSAAAVDSAAARVAALVDGARRERAPIERVADRVARVLVPTVVALAIAAAGFWWQRDSFDRGLMVGLAVLVVACPCALGLATPVALWTGLVEAARRGVVVRSAPALEAAARIDHVLFDKTGTLTGRMPVLRGIDVVAGAGLSERELLARVATLERGLRDPLARAIEAAAATGLDGELHHAPPARDVRVVPGSGVRGRVGGVEYAVGSRRFAVEEVDGGDSVLPHVAPGERLVFIVAARRVLGILRFGEEARPDAGAAVAALARLGVGVEVVSGDSQADAIVPALVPEGAATLGLRPDEKLAHIRAVRIGGDPGRAPAATGRRHVAMVGDGVNDAPALAASDLGIAVATATDLARISADVAIVSDDLERVPWLLAHARRVLRVVRQNLAWAFAYNAGAVALAAAGALNPLVAALAMLGSSVAVVANARRLRAG